MLEANNHVDLVYLAKLIQRSIWIKNVKFFDFPDSTLNINPKFEKPSIKLDTTISGKALEPKFVKARGCRLSFKHKGVL